MMTKKRFTILEFERGVFGIRDNHTEYEYLTIIDLIELLNEQEDRIKELEEKNDHLIIENYLLRQKVKEANEETEL